MDTLDAAQQLKKEFGVDFGEARKAVEWEAQEIRENGKRVNYGYSVDQATERITGWLKTADEYMVKLEWAELAGFVASHRRACVWAVLTGKAIKSREEAK